MPKPKTLVDQELASKAERELKKIENHAICIRLMVIIQANNRTVEEVAQDFNISARTIFRWINRFRKKGVEGLRDRPRGHNPSKLSETHRGEITNWLKTGKNVRGDPIRWTLALLILEIKREFGISISTMPLWRHLRKMGLR